MTTSFDNTVDIIIAVLFLFLFPILLINQHRDSVINIAVERKVSSFVEVVSQNGYISKNMYDEFNGSISGLLTNYKIEFIHEGKTYYPEYQVTTESSGGLTENIPIYIGNTYEIIIDSYTEEILSKIYEKDQIYYLNKGDYFRVRLIQEDRYLLITKGKRVRGNSVMKGGY